MDTDNLFVILFSMVTELLVKTENLIPFWQHQIAYLKNANGRLGAMASFGLPIHMKNDRGYVTVTSLKTYLYKAVYPP